jgi:hypothetical protein
VPQRLLMRRAAVLRVLLLLLLLLLLLRCLGGLLCGSLQVHREKHADAPHTSHPNARGK